MRSHRAVKDDDVDRLQVQGRRRPQPSSTNSPPALPVKAHTLVSAPWVFRMSASAGVRVFSSGLSLFCFRSISETSYSGGFGPGVPPLPIPNREVKPGRADGTAPQCGRVGRRLLERGGSLQGCGEPPLFFSFSPFLSFLPFSNAYSSLLPFLSLPSLPLFLSVLHAVKGELGGFFVYILDLLLWQYFLCICSWVANCRMFRGILQSFI